MATNKTIRFRGYREMTIEEANELRGVTRPPVKEDLDVTHTPDVIQELFAPDPETGNPSSDLFIRASADSDVRDYIDKYLMHQQQIAPVTDDSSLALDSAKSRFESNEEYFTRIKELISNDSK